MTSYIDHQTPPPTGGLFTPLAAFPLAQVGKGWLALWTLPFATAQIWADGWASLVAAREPETDRKIEEDQLPVPNPLQEAKDSELFA